ncbi:MAG: methyltransferase domain-containing protein [Candidatus Limnocylindria bacterium]
MDHADHVLLIRDGVGGGTTWADLGSGTGAFTLALADLLGPGATIHSVDRDPRALEEQSIGHGSRTPTDAAHCDRAKPVSGVDLCGGELQPSRVIASDRSNIYPHRSPQCCSAQSPGWHLTCIGHQYARREVLPCSESEFSARRIRAHELRQEREGEAGENVTRCCR